MVNWKQDKKSNTLFVGITSWNSEKFLAPCLDAVIRTTDQKITHIVVLDNESTDNSFVIAASRDVNVVLHKCNQADALNQLFALSRSEYTLLIHADVILLSNNWFDLCRKKLVGNIALISPEDIGCGPYTRPWGKGMPESSFLLFRTALARSARRWFWRQRFKLRLPYRALDFRGGHITYNLPGMLKEYGLDWRMMHVHPSTLEPTPIYTPTFKFKNWHEAWGNHRYGLGNFYSLDGYITHYHNWFDRVLQDVSEDSQKTLPEEAGGLPLAYLQAYSRKFLSDLENGNLVLPVIESREVSSCLYVCKHDHRSQTDTFMLELPRRMVRKLVPAAWRRQARDLLGLPRVMHDDFAALRKVGTITEPHIVFDVGAYEGWFTKCWLESNPTARVHAFEPSSATFSKKLKPNLGDNSSVTLVQAACGAQNGTFPLHKSQFAAANSFLDFIPDKRLDINFSQEELVDVINLSDYARASEIHEIKLLKIDVQGFELQVLMGAADILDCIGFIYIESSIHPLYKGASTFCDVFQYLSIRGFVLLDIKATDLGTDRLRECDLLFKYDLEAN